MANIPLKSIQFPGLDDTYTVPSNAGELAYNKSATYPADTVGKALQDKPDADGTIANAEQLTSNIYEEDNTPYNFRTSGGSIDIGDRETDMLVGGSVVWNQLAREINTTYWRQNTGITVSFENGEAICTALDTTWKGIYSASNFDIVSGHKYLHSLKARCVDADTTVPLATGLFGTVINLAIVNSTNKMTFAGIVNADATASKTFNVANRNNTNSFAVSGIQLFDLTAMFGSTIADYIYSLEQANAGAGVAWFRKLFPKPYYAYNAGELISVKTSAHNTVGFNAFDKDGVNLKQGSMDVPDSGDVYNVVTGNFIKVVAGASYCWHQNFAPPGRYVRFYDADQNEIVSARHNIYHFRTEDVFTVPSDAHYIKMAWYNSAGISINDVKNGEVNLNISWDGERDGEYEAYVKHSYPLDDSLTLRGIPKLDANNNLYYDGDVYESDGSVTRKYGIVDLGSLTWVLNATNEFATNIPNSKGNTYAGVANAICGKYSLDTYNHVHAHTTDKTIAILSTNSYAYVYDTAYSDANAFKTAMSGVYLVYELATPTTETADPYTNPQIVNDFGTEEYVDYPYSQGTRDVAIPVGHYTQYMANLKAKLEMSPSSPEGAGDYIVRQTNGENEYVTLASNATIQNIIARLEALENAES